MLNLLIFAAVLGILIVMHEFGHFFAALRNGVTVEKFSIGFGPMLLRKKVKGIVFTISLIPFGGYVKLSGDSREESKGNPDEFLSKKIWQRALIVFAGPLLNFLFALVLFWFIFAVGFPMQKAIVGEVLKGYPAESAGIQAGDVIIKINDTAVTYWNELTSAIHAIKPETTVRVTLRRNNLEQVLQIPTRTTSVDTVFQKKKVGIIGVSPSGEYDFIKYKPFMAVVKGTQHTFMISYLTLKGFAQLITGKASLKESVTGPIGIYYITAQAAKAGFVALMNFLAVLSLSLAIFNLVPFPVLDGGHLFFLLVERFRGRPLSEKLEQRITQFGFSVLIVLVVFILYNDILRFGPKLWVK